MDERQFERFLDEFRDMRDEYHEALGQYGLTRMMQQQHQAAQQKSDPRSAGGIRVVGQGEPARTAEVVDRGFLSSIVEDLKTNVYRVRLDHAMQDLILPLYQRLEILQLDGQIFESKLHHENTLYYNAIIEAIRTSSENVKESFLSSVLLQYRMFMRHPIWNTTRLMGEYLVKPMAKAALGIVFGFGKRESTQEKILTAINQQTEFLRKGEIEPSRGFFGRLIEGGLVGALGRGAASLVGMGRGAAQRREDARSRGEEVGGGLHGLLTDILNRRDITRRGRHGEGYVPPAREEDRDPIQKLHEMFAEALKTRQSDRFPQTFNGEYEVRDSITNPIIQSLGGPLQSLSHDSAQSLDIGQQILDEVVKQTQYSRVMADGTIDRNQSAHFERTERRKQEDERVVREEEMNSHISQIARHSKVTAKEAIRARQMRFFSLIANVMGSIGNMATQVVTGIVGAFKGAAGIAMGAAVATALGRASLPVTIRGILSRVALPVTLIGGGVSLGRAIANQLKEITGISEWEENRRQRDIADYGLDPSDLSFRELLSFEDSEKERWRRVNARRFHESLIGRLFGDRIDPSEANTPTAPSRARGDSELILPDGSALRGDGGSDNGFIRSWNRLSDGFETMSSRLLERTENFSSDAVKAIESVIPSLTNEQRDGNRILEGGFANQMSIQEESLNKLSEVAGAMKELVQIQKRAQSQNLDLSPDTQGLIDRFSAVMAGN